MDSSDIVSQAVANILRDAANASSSVSASYDENGRSEVQIQLQKEIEEFNEDEVSYAFGEYYDEQAKQGRYYWDE